MWFLVLAASCVACWLLGYFLADIGLLAGLGITFVSLSMFWLMVVSALVGISSAIYGLFLLIFFVGWNGPLTYGWIAAVSLSLLVGILKSTGRGDPANRY